MFETSVLPSGRVFGGLLVFLKELVFKKKLVFKRDFKNLLILQICKDPYLDCILSSSDR